MQSTALGGLGACPQGNFEKLHVLRLNPFSSLSTFDVPVDTGTENFLIMYYLHAYPCWVALQKLLYIKIVMLVPLKLLLPSLMLL